MAVKEQVVHSDPEIMGGELVFVGTRVPVYNLFDYLEAGDSLDEFIEQFPSVSREQAIAALDIARAALAADARFSLTSACRRGLPASFLLTT